MITGVRHIELNGHEDCRGCFAEVIRASHSLDRIAQINHSRMYVGTIKAWHIHQLQSDTWYLVSGVLKVALHDLREHMCSCGETNEFLLRGIKPELLFIPPGVAHGCKALTECHLIYVCSDEYDGTDEGRLPHDDPAIGYNWLEVDIR